MEYEESVDVVKKIPNGFTKINEDINLCKKHYAYLKDRNLTHCIDTFKIGFTTSTDSRYGNNFKDRIIIPVHNIKGKYIWPEGRLITNVKKRKYYRPNGVNKINALFNLHRTIKIQRKYVIVVEGIIDAMILHMAGYSTVCCFGANLSIEQISALTHFYDIYLCFDVDRAGINGFVKSKKILIGLGMKIYRIKLPRHQDVNLIGISRFKKYFENAKLIY